MLLNVYKLQIASLFFTFACGRTELITPAATIKPPTSISAEWTRAEWLRAVDGFTADPKTMPRLDDPLFQKLVSTNAWLKIDRTIFETNIEEVFRFFPAIKKMTLILVPKTAMDEMLVLGLYTHDVYRALIAASTDYVSHLPANDGSRPARLAGIDDMRLGAAIGICGILFVSLDASDESRSAMVATLTDPASYSFHSREGLQMIAATLDERLLPSLKPALEKPYQTIREVLAQEYDKRSEPLSPIRTTYQGLGPPTQDPTKITTIVSTTGGFSVALGPAGIAKRVEIKQPDKVTSVQHWIELQDGETKFEAICLDGKLESELVSNFQGLDGVSARESEHSGRWFTLKTKDREGGIRILTIAGKGGVWLLSKARVARFLSHEPTHFSSPCDRRHKTQPRT